MAPPPRTPTQQITTLLIVWFAFLNTQLVLAVMSFVLWRSLSPETPLRGAVYWDPAVMNDPLGQALFALSVAAWCIGGFLPLGPLQPVPMTRYLVRFALLESVSLLGLANGFLHRNVLLGIPFIAAAAVGILLQAPALIRLRPPAPPKA